MGRESPTERGEVAERGEETKQGTGTGGNRYQGWGLVASALPGFAALTAVLFTWMQVGQASKELRIAEAGQITDRFNTAVGNLGSASLHVRLGGIYALGRIVQDSPRDDPAVTSVLSAYIRDRAPLPAKRPAPTDKAPTPPADVAAALTVLANRQEPARPLTIDLKQVDLRGLEVDAVPLFDDPLTAKRNFQYANLAGADLTDANISWYDFRRSFFEEANLTDAQLTESDLRETTFNLANMTRAILVGADLTQAQLTGADLSGAVLSHADESTGSTKDAVLVEADVSDTKLVGADLRGVQLARAFLAGSDLTRADFGGADLSGATLSKADAPFIDADVKLARTSFRSADLRGADLRGVDFTDADLRGADLRGAQLSGARLAGAKVDAKTKGLPGAAR
ncbi:pentapeptide repeat-containing protein [Streptomyces sp. NPDC013171]|uniref:pentapeptide repeat-containing protein n=1 Tax=Streptomyces sp. NPDC013171 TaxID=3364863 RepID=UPI0036885D4A